MSADNGENSTSVSNNVYSSESPSSHVGEVSEQIQSADMFSILNRMNDSIMQSTQLLVQVIKEQAKHKRAHLCQSLAQKMGMSIVKRHELQDEGDENSKK